MLLQTSGIGPIPLHIPKTPIEHVCVPIVQRPTSVPHERVTPSSVIPSQSLSTLSQISPLGVQVPQTPPSSMIPSQSLSTPSQISVGAAPQVPHALRTPSSIMPLQLSSTP